MIQRLQTFAWDSGHLLEGLLDAVRWPFERAAWTVERGLVWPLEERTGGWSPRTRIGVVVGLALLAVSAAALGLGLASGSGGDATQVQRQVTAPPLTPVAKAPATAKPEHAAPTLQGARPDFKAEAGGGVAKGSAEAANPAAAATVANSTSEVATSGADAQAAGTDGAVAGPAAIAVAHRFAGAFVLYETGKVTPAVRRTFAESATPQLTRELLRRPPRLPAGVKVPQAKVLNIVPGPHRGNTYTLSASLLRVGVTSELRLDMQRDEKTHEWLVSATRG
jgi:hypothetical protein